MLRNKIIRFKKIYKFRVHYFFKGVIYFHLFIESVFMKTKNSILPPKYTRYGINVRKQISLLQRDLQISFQLFSEKSYIFSFIYRKRFYKSQKFNIPDKIYEMR